MNNKFAITFAMIFLVVIACQNDSSKTVTKPKKVIKKNYKVPAVDGQSLYNFVQKQVDFGPRVPNTQEHTNCKNYIVETLRKYKLRVQEQKTIVTAFDGTKLNATNIIAKYKPERRRRIMLSAHWDTRPFSDHDKNEDNFNKPIDGANDGGSGVAVLLEIARVLQNQDVPLGLDLVFFDAEDYGSPKGQNVRDSYCLGSQFWAKQMSKQPIKPMYGILLDMVGAKNATFTKEGFSLQYAKSVVQNVWKTAHDLGHQKYFSNEETSPVTDDHYYINVYSGIPTIDIIEFDRKTDSHFGHYWHTQKDNMDIIDKNTLKAVAETVLNVYYKEAYE